MVMLGIVTVGVVKGVPKMFRPRICRAHCAVIFAIAQLSCWLFYTDAGCCIDFHPVFRIVDLATGEDFVYKGFYMVRVIAVTDSPTNPPRWFTEEEIVKYNNMNQ